MASKLMAVLFVSTFLCLACNDANAQDKSHEHAASSSHSSVHAEPKLVVPVKKEKLDVKLELPGELLAFRDVPIHAKVEGYISWIGVDRGSQVKKGEPMIKISCPELGEKLSESDAKKSSAESTLRETQSRYQSELERLVEAKTQLDADQLTASRLLEASKTVGAVAQNDVDQAQKKAEASASRVHAIEANVKAVAAVVEAQKNNLQATVKVKQSIIAMQDYLTIRAPFNGTITERNVHEGSIVAVESSKAGLPLVRIQDRKHLRLVVAVPEAAVSGIAKGKVLTFTVPAFLGKVFHGSISRPGYALDRNTRTMPVELDVDNSSAELEPGMYAKVAWQQTRSGDSLFVPGSCVGTDLKGTFVILVQNNNSKRVVVRSGVPMGNLIEIDGPLKEGDTVLLRADDRSEAVLKSGVRLATNAEIKSANRRSAASGE